MLDLILELLLCALDDSMLGQERLFKGPVIAEQMLNRFMDPLFDGLEHLRSGFIGLCLRLHSG